MSPTSSTPPDLGARIAEVYRVVGPLYRRAHRAVANAEHIEGASVGVRAVLDMLREHGPMTVPQMGRDQALSRQFVQRMVNDAVELSWVRVEANPAHKRSSLVTLTATGARTIESIVTRENRVMASIGGGLTRTDVDTTIRVLHEMLELLEPLEDA